MSELPNLDAYELASMGMMPEAVDLDSPVGILHTGQITVMGMMPEAVDLDSPEVVHYPASDTLTVARCLWKPEANRPETQGNSMTSQTHPRGVRYWVGSKST